MICPKCNGKGSVYNALGSFYEDCGHCQGTGKVRAIGEPMTNEEWFCNLSTKEKAKVIVNIHNLANIKQIEWWLKQPHHNEVEK